MKNDGKIIVVGIGPGNDSDITVAVRDVLGMADVVVGYKYYFRFVKPFLRPDAECVDTGMKGEIERAKQAFAIAEKHLTVVVISSGDAGIYGMAPLIYEMQREQNSHVEVSSYPGISAFQKAASLLGAPIGHDFCVISLSDLMTPWSMIEKRVRAAALGDFITAVYNPKSTGRYWQMYRFKEVFLNEGRSPETPVGFVRQAGRADESVTITTLGELNPEDIDMFTVVIIGNSQTYSWHNKMITPRGYYAKEPEQDVKIGQNIMIRSFRTIEKELRHPDIPIDRKWALLHAIHTTADFSMEDILYADPGAVETLFRKIKNGELKTIVTDVTMAVSGIRKGALQRLGVEAKCYLDDDGVAEMASQKGITRSQAGIIRAVEEHPDALFAFGNAPTALMQLCELMRQGKAHPAGIIAAPVGFVHVCESKYMVKTFSHIPKIIIEGRKGGSNLAATLVNSILCFDDAALLKPGRDV